MIEIQKGDLVAVKKTNKILSVQLIRSSGEVVEIPLDLPRPKILGVFERSEFMTAHVVDYWRVS